MTLYLGIDPGAGGGIAIVSQENHLVAAIRMPKTEADVIASLRQFPVSMALVEDVHSFPEMGCVSAFTFGRGAGVIIGCLLTLGIGFEEIRPRDWQRILRIPPRVKRPRKPKPGITYPPEETQSQWKNRLKAKAQQLYPAADITLYTADAILIAEVARRRNVLVQEEVYANI